MRKVVPRGEGSALGANCASFERVALRRGMAGELLEWGRAGFSDAICHSLSTPIAAVDLCRIERHAGADRVLRLHDRLRGEPLDPVLCSDPRGFLVVRPEIGVVDGLDGFHHLVVG